MAEHDERVPEQEPGPRDARLSLRGLREWDLTQAEAAIVRAEMAVTHQRWVIDATTRASQDTGGHLALLAAMEQNLADLHAWRGRLLDGCPF